MWIVFHRLLLFIGNTIYQFLQRCLDSLRKDFHELKTISADQLMYVKEDLIIPHHYSFYDFIVTKVRAEILFVIYPVQLSNLLCNWNLLFCIQARGKSGPLFSFDVHDDIRIVSDASVEKDESHAGKVLLRNWYERNKHIFPASRWEPYDPTKTYEKYSIKDKNKKNAAWMLLQYTICLFLNCILAWISLIEYTFNVSICEL